MTLDEIIIEKAAQNRIEMRKVGQQVFEEVRVPGQIIEDDLTYEWHQGKHAVYLEILAAFLGEDNLMMARNLIQDKVKELQ